jgi:hypothetical protein
MLAAVVAPLACASLLISLRGRLDPADNALILVVVIVAVASTGRRMAAVVAAISSALSFDFFLTRPYNSFRITRHADLITGILLLVLGTAVGEIAARGRNHRLAAWQSRSEVASIHSVTELAASGREPRVLIAAAADELRSLLLLRGCEFTRSDPGRVVARVTSAGDLMVGGERWSTDDLGLPARGVDLPVRGNGWLLGHFVLTPTPGASVPRERLVVAVAIADQVGAVLAVDQPVPSSPA